MRVDRAVTVMSMLIKMVDKAVTVMSMLIKMVNKTLAGPVLQKLFKTQKKKSSVTDGRTDGPTN